MTCVVTKPCLEDAGPELVETPLALTVEDCLQAHRCLTSSNSLYGLALLPIIERRNTTVQHVEVVRVLQVSDQDGLSLVTQAVDTVRETCLVDSSSGCRTCRLLQYSRFLRRWHLRSQPFRLAMHDETR
jgi:hypothetical protein